MQPDFAFTLGAFQFEGPEVPEKIAVGGVQQLVAHELIGGIRVIDAMGARESALEWSGWLLGQTAEARATYLEALRVAAAALPLTWSTFNFTVIIREFEYDFERFYQLRYRIVCEVVSNNALPSGAPDTVPPIDSALADDLDAANTLSDSIGDMQLSSLMSSLSAAIGTVASFSGAVPSTVNTVLQPLAAATARVAVLTATNNSAIAGASGFAGVAVGALPSVAAASLGDQLETMQQLSSLAQLQGLLGRMGANLGAINASENVLPVAGGNLFSIASDQYGDPSAWTTIAGANGLTDPFIVGPTDLTIPAIPDDLGGVLNS